MRNEQFLVNIFGRIDKVLALHLNVSRNQTEKLIKERLVLVNNKVITKPSFKVKEGDKITYKFKEAQKREPIKVNFNIEVLYEDKYLMIINKPSGLVVHPAPSVKEATLVDWLVQRGISLSTISGEERHGIVHRIDKETTGALVIAKNNKVHEKLSAQLQNKSMGRYYLALIDHPLKEDTVVNKPIGRNPKNRLKMDVVPNGKEAKTAFVKLLETEYGTELIVAKLFTGRTHQIRVHLNTLGRHILGDHLYGFKSKRDKIPRVYLHAYLLYLTHPVTGKIMEFIAPLFHDMNNYLLKYLDRVSVHKKLEPKMLKKEFE
ncbi:MAG: RluA family pseudouridine synthase [Sulfurovum sp.]|nr:RluA family pseudouridine synthase [Sulfurovum sp.]MCB4750709.1 RluA family pseudouridine synthase [Sulfurovum sp.]MCB4753505.1 RluA family pseudouridine synthase [Sulfurovum sp.]MCB4754600.1 RluA family pseudouridine synthase [Sulfurovum sp.]MCB4760901.1 RluA family pseudouridine synthase [Sulfurovum sp.]